MKFFRFTAALMGAAFLFNSPRMAQAHGFAGKRFFPATLATDDPFVADEASLPTFSTIVTPDDGGTRETEFSADIAKTITPWLGVEIGGSLVNIDPPGGRSQTGAGNLELGAKWQFLKNAEHEAIASVGFDAEIGGTGSRDIGADTFSTWTPTLYFGKGLGDLPDAVWPLRPLAITGTFGVSIPSRANNKTLEDGDLDIEANPHAMEFGFAVEYSLIYFQQNVRDLGIPAPFDRLIPIVEFTFDSPLDRGQSGLITGTINPGILWSGKSVQLGVEAIIPINSRTGNEVGVIAQVHLYLDDILPTVFRPIFGGRD
jgi:hypothetical protein